ncbi:flagellar basal body rod protein FlgC [Bordetella sp. 15P40C-2]|uniref:flagellar basal body rod protein FlgC n=1 Tax=Bordetella sp. 15P40C-2 TaxID=2572246 RepID=UPI00132B9B3E|nr:flagellar basal body rod protein FlgC [Bordetella sp. 15P40C-2]MVW69995.1 flagellar basal body rod protein FlgC [Bordetella sp. 15P40C-2]
MTLSIFQIAGSALTAQSQRMNVSASNLANANSVAGPDGQPYRAKQVVFQVDPLGDAMHLNPIGGVKVAGVVDSQAPMRRQYDPKNPAADQDGYVTLPNVDVVAETVNMISASRSYQANVEIVNTAKSLLQRTLSIGQ